MFAGPPQVTIVAHEVGTPGGMERQLGILVRGLLARGYEVTVVARQCEVEPQDALRWVRVPGPRRPFALWFAWFFVLGSLAAWRARRGLLHTTGALVANKADISTVHFCHKAFHGTQAARGSAAYKLNAWLVSAMSRLAESWCYRPSRTRKLIAVSKGVERELDEFFPEASVEVIPNGVDHAAFAPGPRDHEGDLVALFVGGDWERKGLRYAIEALVEASEWRLVVVGGGDEAAEQERADRLGVGDRVEFAGRTPDPRPFYAAADAFLLPTAYETFSLVTYEAAASGLPLLVSLVSGVEDLLVAGRNGWFVERDAGQIAGRLRELAADPGLRRSMGDAAREDSARFDWESVVAAYDRLYRGVLR